MALLACLSCATKFAVGLLRCPHCSSTDFEEADLPKITVSGGVSHPEDHRPDDYHAQQAGTGAVSLGTGTAPAANSEPLDGDVPPATEPAPEPESVDRSTDSPGHAPAPATLA